LIEKHTAKAGPSLLYRVHWIIRYRKN